MRACPAPDPNHKIRSRRAKGGTPPAAGHCAMPRMVLPYRSGNTVHVIVLLPAGDCSAHQFACESVRSPAPWPQTGFSEMQSPGLASPAYRRYKPTRLVQLAHRITQGHTDLCRDHRQTSCRGRHPREGLRGLLLKGFRGTSCGGRTRYSMPRSPGGKALARRLSASPYPLVPYHQIPA